MSERVEPTIGRASAVLASGTIVSRILGFVSAAVLASAIGIIGAGADTFALANQLPNNVYALVAGGLLSAVIVPQIVRAGMHDDGGARFVNKLVTLGLVVFLAVTVIATLCAPLLVALYSDTGPQSGFSERDVALATSFAYWCLPQVFFYAVYSLAGEVLNARGVFGPFTWTPAANNVIAIGGLLIFIALFGPDPAHRDSATWTTPQVAVLAGSATLGIAVQAFLLFLFWTRAGLRFRPDFRWRGVGLRGAGESAAWVFGMFLVTQVSGVVESRVALSASGEASLGVLKYAWLMFIVPHSVVTVSIVTAYFTRMSTHARDNRLPAVRADLEAALRSVLLILIFSAIGLSVLAYPFSAVFAGTFSDVQALASVYLAYLAGLVPFTIFFVLLRVYYAIDDTRTPFFIQIAQTTLFVGGALLIGALVESRWIAVALALLLSFAVTFQAVLAAWFLRRKLGPLGTIAVARSALWFTAAALPAAAAGLGLLAALGWVNEGSFAVSSRWAALAILAVVGLLMAGVYAVGLAITRNPEFLALARPVLSRMRRAGRA